MSNKKILFYPIGIAALFGLLWWLFFFLEPVKALLIIFGILLIFFIFTKPLYGLFLLLLVRPTLDIFTHQAVFSWGNFSLNIASLSAVLIISFSFLISLTNLKKFSAIPLKKSWLLFIFLSFISIFYSLYLSLSLIEWLRILSIFSLYCLGFILIKNPAELKRLILIIVLSALIPGLVAFFQFFNHTGMTIIDENISNRIFGTFAHPNLLAYYLIIPLALSVLLILERPKKLFYSSFLKIIFIYLFILLLLTYTRGAWVVFLIIIILFGIVRYRKLLLASLLGMFLLYLLIPPIQTRINNLFEYDPFSSITWRINLWKDALHYSQEKVIGGHGLGTANSVILDRRGEKLGSPDPHNDYLKILLENGLIGLSAYLILISNLLLTLFFGFKKSSENFSKNLYLLFLGIALALYFMSFADNILRNTALQWAFWVLLGGLFSAYPQPRIDILKSVFKK
ncbi:MAG: O-antigen ligase family protein [Candidatus Moraniibacteriota bacterium]